ncbi:glycosyltransferase family 2 protein [Neobacillus terrae]|uniref:glycosyltransferase family 2 protein n=1 Tax=Neobacillus terrae TaxID=3034837 RepID=UPI0014075DDD|nr:glycosyltransferase family 2 protein [Neobacillus terrae]NHM29994.1 glycosyltransferase family 2 protein [Neobacillus terrae]
MTVILNPDISIIIPVYNGAGTIKQAIASCLAQTYENFEIIIVDNASTDNTKEIVSSFNSEKVKYFYTDQKGRSNARNIGLQKAKGEWIQFLDADDLLDENKLTSGMKILKSNSSCDAVQCSTEYVKNGKVINNLEPYCNEDVYDNLLVGNTIPINSILLRKSKCSLFPQGMEYCEDWVFWIESLLDCHICFDKSLSGAKVIVHEANTMSNIQKMKFYELEVLLKYRNKKIHFKKSLLRDIKIIKRYAEYLLFADKSNAFIDSNANKYLYLKTLKSICRITVIRNYLKRKIGEKNKQNVYQ